MLPLEASHMISGSWTIQAEIPSELIASYDAINSKLLHPSPGSIPAIGSAPSDLKLADSAQNLELTPEINDWTRQDQGPQGAVSMLNLLAFKPGKEKQYMKYFKEFSNSAGKRRGGVAKLVGEIVPDTCSDGSNEWDKMALGHYLSLKHFADMIGNEDYQQANQEWRVPSLKDTFILCTTELDIESEEKSQALVS